VMIWFGSFSRSWSVSWAESDAWAEGVSGSVSWGWGCSWSGSGSLDFSSSFSWSWGV